ncbi:transposase [Kutzneria sp. 744]|uniref:IS701 family transposase n=1 Tax=Kutzneria sp. (strain 744) TaxID=345341 RepID=UPI0003EEC972|nr:transposase [Kutzneria sp. 744]EWM12153.1 transposase [Kutzneria sp. 744]
MLPDGTIPGSLADLLAVFRPCFTAPTFSTFQGLALGLIAQTRRRTVCGMLLGAGLERLWHHSRAHRFFAAARWSTDQVGLALADLIVARLLPAGSPITIAVDDTLFKRSGMKVFGVAWHHDGAAKGPKPIGFGNCWVIAGIIVQLPFLSRPVCLPVLARLWRPRRTGKLAYAREMAELIAARHPDRTVHVVGDAAYVGEHLRGLAPQITWTSRLKVTSVLHELAPPHNGKMGRPRTKGPRLGTPSDLAATATWRTTRVRRYGRTDTVHVAEVICLWYGSFHTRTVRVVLVRDDKPRTSDRDERGYGLPLVTTDLTSAAEDLVARYASRWGIEQAFADARQVIGVGQARNRLRRAVERTVPFGLTCLSVVTVWYALHGHAPEDTAIHRSRARWYTTKTEPSYDDMVIKLRRVIIAARFRNPRPDLVTPQETQAVLAAWAAAGT